MTQALFTSMTGLNAGTEQLTVVSDNVANMNTTAYKTSRVDFQDIWYQTKTAGTSSTKNSGGTNPYQIGVGVQCASITKDFGASSLNTTGRAEDMALQGDGWFTVINADGAVMLTRDGTFALDENGYLCTASGSKVLGMNENMSASCSNVPIKIPTQIKVIEEPTPVGEDDDGDGVISSDEGGKFGAMTVSELNNLGSATNGITNGTFEVVIHYKDPTKDPVVATVTLGSDTVKINDGNVNALLDDIKDDLNAYCTVGFEAGRIAFTPNADVASMEFKSVTELKGGTNFLAAANLASAPLVDGRYATNVLNQSATISIIDDVAAESTKIYKSFSVGKDGLITATYSDNSTLTIKNNEDGSSYFCYTTSEGVIINDDTQNSGNASLYVDPNVLLTANMQLQLAKVANNGGLVACGSNTYQIGPDCGPVIYSAANVHGVGSLATGALESSNVDLAQQFSNMILAQRLVQANSQVFSNANSMLETLVYLGQ